VVGSDKVNARWRRNFPHRHLHANTALGLGRSSASIDGLDDGFYGLDDDFEVLQFAFLIAMQDWPV
jgi:hypothetical protein